MDKQGHNLKIGLLGGSFNPAHEGHVEISLHALEKLQLDYIWWLVSPGNPLKKMSEMASFDLRLKSAKNIADDPRIIVSDFEQKAGTKYTIDTISKLKEVYPDHHFVWLMGADNLEQFDKWKSWEKIGQTVPFAIFNRPSYSTASLQSPAAQYFMTNKIEESKGHELYKMKPPAWVYIKDTHNPLSSTEIRTKSNHYKRLHT